MKRIHLFVLLVGFTLFRVLTADAQLITLSPERTGHDATLLNSGMVLITGGANETATLDSALLYDPATGNITPTGSLTTPRANHTSTLLPNGQVLITGGDQSGVDLQTAELYDPSTGIFTQTFQGMRIARSQHTATLLPNGQVLIVGGKSADLYDPAAQTFTATIGTPLNRRSHSSILLQDGTVLIVGGYINNVATDAAEIYDPSTQIFTVLANSMVVPRANLGAVLLPNGKVFITGGFSGTSPHNETEDYDPVAQTFTLDTPMVYHRSNHQELLQGDGRVVVIGGITLESGFLSQDEVYDPSTQLWTPYASLLEDRAGHTATMLQSGNILVAGGVTGNQTLQSAEILDPTTMSFTSIGNMQVARNEHRATLLNDGTVLLTGGSNDTQLDNLNSNELFDPSNNSFTLVGSMIDGRKSHTATLLPTGNVLAAGGKGGVTGYLRSAEVYDPTTQLFHSASDMNSVRALHTATLLNDGEVLLSGGVITGGVSTYTAELFRYSTETFNFTGRLNLQRKRHRASLLNDGTVLVEGGDTLPNAQGGGDRETPTAELYDLTTQTWAMVGDMSVARAEHESTLLDDGTVLVTGGTVTPVAADLYDHSVDTFSTVGQMIVARGRHVSLRLDNPAWGALQGHVLAIGGSDIGSTVFGGAQVALDSVEIYDPATGQFNLFGTMTVARQSHTATELTDGRILITGGVGRPYVSGTAEVLAGPTPSPTPIPTPTPSPTPTPTPMPPTVVTLDATDITSTAVMFNGTVNPRGSDTTYYFDYGLTDSYGLTTTVTDAGSGTTTLKVATGAMGLTPSTLYHFRITGTNAGGTAYGADFTVTTAAVTPTPTPTPTPPTVVTLDATDITATTVMFNGTVNPRGSDTTYHFDYGLTDSYGSTTTVTDAGSGTTTLKVATGVMGLTPGTLYHFRISATNAGGTATGADFTVTTAPPTPTPTPTPLPPTVVTLDATNITATTVMFNGTVNPRGYDTTYHFDYGLTDSYGSTTTVTNAGSGTTTLKVAVGVMGLTPGTLYHFRISATNSFGTATGGDFTVTTAMPTPTPTPTPPAVVTLAATSITSNGVTFNGTVNPQGSDTMFHFDYGLTDSYGSTTTVTDAGSGTAALKVTAAVTGLSSSTLYHFRITATNAGGTSNGTDLTVTTVAPTPTPTPSPTPTITPTPTPTPSPAKPLNISTRVETLTGEDVMIGGFIITGGTTPKKVVIRAIGPSLSNANPPVPGALADPILQLHLPDGSVVTNDNWQTNNATDVAFIKSVGLAPASPLESVIVATLAPVDPNVSGSGLYTAIVNGVNNTTGTALVEVYDVDPPGSTSTLANISTRGFVQTKDSAMIGGFIAGSGASTGQVLIRAIGPSLAGSNISNPLQDPLLELHNATGATVASNDNWGDTDKAAIQATGLAPTNPLESAILTPLAPGAYTAVVRGNNDTVGVGLVEVYYLP